ncbi:CAMP phosphodiesterases class-II:Metallo-beta-lactamase superfamily [hydrothermal vent metagenome]|uniref:cAMP phosphodiesterases class-II:Metallo-beta-lactamase superfamily n=1 Tax=hydrothermal vent metagenome TaxID=652676 RepID=A0A3B0ZNI0_9ZZZZ
MKVQILGCSGGISEGLKTTSLLVDNSVLIDAGTGIGDLSLDTLRNIRTVFLTHSHLDHVCGLPLLIDTIFDQLVDNPLTVYARPETIEALKKHIFNNVIWPDFTRIPSVAKAVLKFQAVELNHKVEVKGVTFELLPVNHVVPACGYRVTNGSGSFAFSGDTTSNDTFWDALNSGPAPGMLIVEAAFPDSDIEICKLAYHYCPSLLAADIKKLKHKTDIYLTHLKPGSEKEIIAECKKAIKDRAFRQLESGEIFDL